MDETSINHEEEQTLYSWEAPTRVYKKRSIAIMRFYLVISILISIILLFFGDKILVITVLGLFFLFYVLTTTTPDNTNHSVTKFGLELYGIHHSWDRLSRFYFVKRFEYDVLVVVGDDPYYEHAYAVIPTDKVKRDIIILLSRYLRYQKRPELTLTDKLVSYFSKIIPQDV